MSERGLTMIELMITLVIGTLALSMIGGTAWHVSRGHRVAALCERDLDEARVALAQLEADLRAADRVKVAGSEVVAQGAPDGDVVWRLDRGTVVRAARGSRRVVARGVATFDVRGEGPIVRVALRLVPRAGTTARRAVLVSEVCPRGGQP